MMRHTQYIQTYIHTCKQKLQFYICRLASIYYLLFTIYYLLFTIYYFIFTIYCLLFIIYYLLFTFYHLLFTICYLLSTFPFLYTLHNYWWYHFILNPAGTPTPPSLFSCNCTCWGPPMVLLVWTVTWLKFGRVPDFDLSGWKPLCCLGSWYCTPFTVGRREPLGLP